jgi:aspartyl-tRNA(Asn)/glutamyl-tRNA(Gln) amidotransferase subunit B
MPGVLPVLNKRAVEYGVKMALAVDCRVNPRSIFARKNYFYPDLPKGYQISQYELPLAEHGQLIITCEQGEKKVGITRIHMEEDAGKSMHAPAENRSYVDLNRTGVPLLEIVSEPDLRSPQEAVAYLKSLRAILVYIDICDGNMEEGSFRCDANISLRPKGQGPYGTRTELKNLNSFRHVQRALVYEIGRQQDLLEAGEGVIQETRLYDVDKGVTKGMRGKEEAHDYRYFPDPDLVPLDLPRQWLEGWARELPELPAAKKRRFEEQYPLTPEEIQTLISERDFADYFESVVAQGASAKQASNWMLTEMLREMHNNALQAAQVPFGPAQLAALLRLVQGQRINSKIAKDIYPELFQTGLDPEGYVREHGLEQISDAGRLDAVVQEVLEEHPEEVKAYKAGKKKLQSFFVGQVMRKTKGQANPKLVNESLVSKLGG